MQEAFTLKSASTGAGAGTLQKNSATHSRSAAEGVSSGRKSKPEISKDGKTRFASVLLRNLKGRGGDKFGRWSASSRAKLKLLSGTKKPGRARSFGVAAANRTSASGLASSKLAAGRLLLPENNAENAGLTPLATSELAASEFASNALEAGASAKGALAASGSAAEATAAGAERETGKRSGKSNGEISRAGAVAIADASGEVNASISNSLTSELKRKPASSHPGKKASQKTPVKVLVVDLRQPADLGDGKQQALLRTGPITAETVNGESLAENAEAGPGTVVFVRQGALDRGSALQPRALESGPATFAERFQQLASPEIVKRAGIILRSNNQGEIRLVLKPESLGSVRIQINLNESIIEGRIVVENNSVKEIFEQNLDHLKNAFKEQGYQARLEVSVGNRDASSQKEDPEPQASGRRAADELEEIEKMIPFVWKNNQQMINLFV